MRGPASRRMTRASLASMRRKSGCNETRAISAIAPAISTPVGPPPTMTKVSSALRCSVRASSAFSKTSKILRRIAVASSTSLQARRGGGPVVMAEIGMRGARRQNQKVVWKNLGAGEHEAAFGIDAGNLGHQNRDVPLPAK